MEETSIILSKVQKIQHSGFFETDKMKKRFGIKLEKTYHPKNFLETPMDCINIESVSVVSFESLLKVAPMWQPGRLSMWPAGCSAVALCCVCPCLMSFQDRLFIWKKKFIFLKIHFHATCLRKTVFSMKILA